MSGPVLTSSTARNFRQPLCWPLMPLPDENGRLNYPDLESSVRHRIEVILRTSPGESLMRPHFGAGLEQLVHQPNTVSVRASAQKNITGFLSAFEPRILLDHVNVRSGEDARTLLVNISYRIRSTGVAQTISVTMPIGGA
ncbi:MAG: GPW/gp25 family protein [Sphingorhabdus sp.]